MHNLEKDAGMFKRFKTEYNDEMPTLDPVASAFHFAYVDTGIWYEDAREDFTRRWGGDHLGLFLQVLIEGAEDDRVVAIWAIALSQHSQAERLLSAFLRSPSPKERWSSALCLGEMGEEQAVPVLCEMLTEFLPTKQSPWPQEPEKQWWYERWRLEIPSLLHAWESPAVTVALHRGLESLINAEQYAPFAPDQWFSCQDRIAYELGFRNTFGVMTGSSLSSYRVRIAVVNMTAGAYEALQPPDKRCGYTLLPRWLSAKLGIDSLDSEEISQLRAGFIEIMMERFGMADEEAIGYLEKYGEDDAQRRAGFAERMGWPWRIGLHCVQINEDEANRSKME